VVLTTGVNEERDEACRRLRAHTETEDLFKDTFLLPESVFLHSPMLPSLSHEGDNIKDISSVVALPPYSENSAAYLCYQPWSYVTPYPGH
jgi:hypothetical protein